MSDGGWVHDDEDMVDGKHFVSLVLHFCSNVIAALRCLTLHAENAPQFFSANPIGQNGGYDLTRSVLEVSNEFLCILSFVFITIV
jgi:nucleotide-sensitive chloride channel 1A